MISQYMQSFIFPSIQVLCLLIKARIGKRELCYPQILKAKAWRHTVFIGSITDFSGQDDSILHMC